MRFVLCDYPFSEMHVQIILLLTGPVLVSASPAELLSANIYVLANSESLIDRVQRFVLQSDGTSRRGIPFLDQLLLSNFVASSGSVASSEYEETIEHLRMTTPGSISGTYTVNDIQSMEFVMMEVMHTIDPQYEAQSIISQSTKHLNTRLVEWIIPDGAKEIHIFDIPPEYQELTESAKLPLALAAEQNLRSYSLYALICQDSSGSVFAQFIRNENWYSTEGHSIKPVDGPNFARIVRAFYAVGNRQRTELSRASTTMIPRSHAFTTTTSRPSLPILYENRPTTTESPSSS